MTNEPRIEAYQDFRAYLADWHAWRQRLDPTFSKAEFSRRLGLPNSRGYLTQVLAGRVVSEAATERFVVAMGLEGEKARLFRILVRWNQAASEEEKELYGLHRARREETDLASLKERVLEAWEGIAHLAGDALHRAIVELTRGTLGHVRAGLLLVEGDGSKFLRGTWGTDHRLRTVDERSARVSARHTLDLLMAHREASGLAWQLRLPASIGWHDRDGIRHVLADAWVEGHLLSVRGRPLGILYVDPGLSSLAPDPLRREATIFWARLVAGLLARSS